MSQQQTLTTLDGCLLSYTEHGAQSLPPLILSNSLGATQSMWDGQIAAFSQHFRTISYDTRGHGSSAAPAGAYSLDRLGRDVLDLLDHLKIERAHFCGVSLGGMTGQWLASHAPTRISRLVLAHTSAHMPPASAWQDRIDTVSSRGMSAIAEAVACRWVTSRFRDERPEEFARLISEISEVDPMGYIGCCAAIRDMDLRPVLANIRTDCRIIAGLEDFATPLEHAQYLGDHIAGSDIVQTNGAHVSNIECAAEFNRHVIAFLNNQ